jgi:hypothetical protein
MSEREIENAIGRLEKIANEVSGWETLYRDRSTGALWEVSYPMGEMHGGGPRRLATITHEDAVKKYSSAKL